MKTAKLLLAAILMVALLPLGVVAGPAAERPAGAADPAEMARAFRLAVEAGRVAFKSGPRAAARRASASSPLTGFLTEG